MINYRKVYQAWLAYVREGLNETHSVVDFVAGYNAAISVGRPKPKTSMERVLEKYPDAYYFYRSTAPACPYEIWGTNEGEWMILGVGKTETEAWDEANEFLTEE